MSGLERARGIIQRAGVFKQILDFKEAALARLRDKRKGVRYPVGPGFPLKGTVSLRGNTSTSCNWSGQFANLSHTGASLLLPPAAVTVRGEKTTLHLSIGQHTLQHTLQLPCVVAHFRVLATHAVCGLTLDFPDFTVQKGFAQLLEAVRIGASFEPTKAASPRRSAGPTMEQYRADTSARLSVWRGEDGRIERVEFILGKHMVRGDAGSDLEILAKDDGEDQLGKDVTEEVRRLYRWLLPNLNKRVPADVREFLRQAGTGSRPAIAAAPKPVQLSTAPGQFPPPRRPGTRPPVPPR